MRPPEGFPTDDRMADGTSLSGGQRSPSRPRANILGVRIDALTIPELHRRLQDDIVARRKALVLHVNAHALNLAYTQRWYRDFLNQADVVFCDGAGVALGARLLGHRIPQRITYADWMWRLAEFAENQGFSFFFLGGHPGVAERAAQKLAEHFPRLRVLGVRHGYFDKSPASPENERVLEAINALQPDILLVGFGMPLQERWLMQNWRHLHASVALTGGAVFDYVSGDLRRAPAWMTEHGLEWLGRLLIEPRRLWRRYVLGNPLFLWRVARQRLRLRSR